MTHDADGFRLGRDGSVARWLVRRAARHVPSHLSARLEEEWLADLASRRGRGSQLRLALGCCQASILIAREHFNEAPQPASAPVALLSPRSGIVTFPARRLHYFTLRPGTLFLIVGLQVALLCGLVLHR